MATPIRHVRISDDLWSALAEKAKAEGVSIASLIVKGCQSVLGIVPTDEDTGRGTEEFEAIVDRKLEPLLYRIELLESERGKLVA